MTSVLIEDCKNAMAVEPTINSIMIELIDIFTIYYWLHPGQIIPEHREVTA